MLECDGRSFYLVAKSRRTALSGSARSSPSRLTLRVVVPGSFTGAGLIFGCTSYPLGPVLLRSETLAICVGQRYATASGHKWASRSDGPRGGHLSLASGFELRQRNQTHVPAFGGPS